MLSHACFLAFHFVIVLQSLKGKVLKELKELVIILRGRHRLYPYEELVHAGDIDARHQLLYGRIDHAHHLFMLAQLAPPKEVH